MTVPMSEGGDLLWHRAARSLRQRGLGECAASAGSPNIAAELCQGKAKTVKAQIEAAMEEARIGQN